MNMTIKPRKIKIKLDYSGMANIDEMKDIPFAISRVSYVTPLADLHSHDIVYGFGVHKAIIAVKGKMSVTVESDELEDESWNLIGRNEGLMIYPDETARLSNFSDDCVCLILSSSHPEYVWDINLAHANVNLEQNLAFSMA